jgi:hypothetical protein
MRMENTTNWLLRGITELARLELVSASLLLDLRYMTARFLYYDVIVSDEFITENQIITGIDVYFFLYF